MDEDELKRKVHDLMAKSDLDLGALAQPGPATVPELDHLQAAAVASIEATMAELDRMALTLAQSPMIELVRQPFIELMQLVCQLHLLLSVNVANLSTHQKVTILRWRAELLAEYMEGVARA